MITRTQSYQTSDGQVFGTLEEAQLHELVVWIRSAADTLTEKAEDTLTVNQAEIIASALQKDAAKIIDILTTTATSKPKARRVNGGTKKRKADATEQAPSAAPAQ